MSRDPMVIIGAGHAGRRAAETLRAIDPSIDIILIGDEPELPYDRPALSKEALISEMGEQRAFLHDRPWYDAHRIDLRLGIRAQAIDRDTRRIRLADGTALPYARLLLTPGSRVRRFPNAVDGRVTLHYVRTLADTRTLRLALNPGKHVAVIGGGFIGLEVAASAIQRGCRVTLIEPADRLIQRGMPEALSAFVLATHQKRGVDVRLGTRPQAIDSRQGRAVIQTQNDEIEADVVVIGIGVIPNTELAHAAGLDVDNGIVVDEQCRTLDPDIFAAGEATMHFHPQLERRVRVESWQVAEKQPAIAAANMLGGAEIYREIPWLWSDQYEHNLQTLGQFDTPATLVQRGVPSSDTFSVFALDARHRITAVATVNEGSHIAICRRLMNSKKPLSLSLLADTTIPLRSLLS